MTDEDAVPNIDINPNDWAEIRRILRTCVPEFEVWAFGSRAKWTAKPYSDLDLAILTDKPLSLQKAAELRSALDESTVPIKVDFVDWTATSESFQRVIEADKVVVLRPATGLSGWAFKRLIDCTVDGELSYGIVQPGQHDERGVPIVRVNNISTGELHVDDPLRVASKIEANYRRTRLEGGEVLLTVVGTTGQSVIVPKELAGWNVARAVAVIRPKPEIGARWIHICLQSKAVQQFLDERANTTVQKTLNLSDIKEVMIPIPPLGVKEMIESLAVGLDDRIELNRRMNATLEAQAQALFQSWFVDFDPVRSKLDGRSLLALDASIAALFPSSFQDSELGPIPHGWTAQRLPGAIEVNPRRTLKRGTIAPYLDMKNLPTRGHSAEEVVDREFSSGTKFQNGDTLLARITPCLENGKTGYVDFLKDGQVGWGSTEYIVLSPKPPLPKLFGYLLARSDALRSHAIQNMTGTSGRQRVPSECFSTFWLAVPTSEIANLFNELTRPLMAKIKANSTESRILAALRNTLLPRLLSGELRIQRQEVVLNG